jgi:imidazolonepropionase-like amidohydrolase
VRRRHRATVLASVAAALCAGWLWLALQPPRLALPASGAVLARVDLVEPGGQRARDVTVRLENGRIVEIRPSRPSDAPTFACDRCVVLPGLIDLHVHHPPALLVGQRELFALLFLAHGVTSVRDTGILDLSLDSHRSGIEAGERAGPRVFSCGRILDAGPHAFPAARVVADPAAARRAVASLAAEGAACVKVYGGVPEATLRSIQAEAAERGMRVVAHAPRAFAFGHLAKLEIQHLTGLMDQGNVVSDEQVRSYVEHSRAAGISHVPTLVVFARDRPHGIRIDPPLPPHLIRRRDRNSNNATRAHLPKAAPTPDSTHGCTGDHLRGKGVLTKGRIVEAVHNLGNLVPIDRALHTKITSYLNSVRPEIADGTMRVRDWLGTQSWEAQEKFGRELLERFGGG